MSKIHSVKLIAIIIALGIGFFSLRNQDEYIEPTSVEFNGSGSVEQKSNDKTQELLELRKSYSRLKAYEEKKKSLYDAVDKLHATALSYQTESHLIDEKRHLILDGKTINTKGEILLSENEKEELRKILEDQKLQQRVFLDSMQKLKRSIYED